MDAPIDPPDGWPLIVGGSHRSGTTLLRRLLDGHPRIFCPPEIKFYSDLLGEHPNDAYRHLSLGATIGALGLPEHAWLDAFARTFVALYGDAARARGKARWADKNPENAIHAEHWARALGGQLHFVLVVRHPYDVVASMTETPMPRALPQTAEGRARHVRRYVESGLAYVRAHPERSTIVRYEELVAQPERVLGALLAAAGERFDPAMLAQLGSGAHGDGIQDPKARSRAEVTADSVGRWRRDLRGDDLAAVSAIASDLVRQLGYADVA